MAMVFPMSTEDSVGSTCLETEGSRGAFLGRNVLGIAG